MKGTAPMTAMKRLVPLGLLLGILLVGPAQSAVTTTNSYSITITVTPAVASVNLSNTALNTTGATNANAIIGAVSVTTNPPGGTFTGPIVSGGTDAAKFALTNGGVLPCNLTVGAANVAAGTYAITLSATQ
jgi:hypothetical protein